MTTVTDNDLRELKDLIKDLKTEIKSEISEFKSEMKSEISGMKSEISAMKSNISEMNQKLTDLEKNQIKLETKFDGNTNTVNAQFETLKAKIDGQQSNLTKVPDLIEKVGELKNWKQGVIIIFTASITATITWFIRDVLK